MYMNELVNFKKIDIIKEMIKEKVQSIESKIDYDNTLLGDITMDYFYDYIEPMLLELNNKGILEYDRNKIKYFVNPKTEEERYINYSIEAIMMSILNGLFYTNTSLGEYETILSLIENGSDDDKKKLAWIIYFDVFSTQYTEENLKEVYEIALTYGNNKNKYGQYDFNDYNKIITTIFDIK